MNFVSLRDRARDLHQVEPDVVPRMLDDTDFDCTEARNVYAAIKRYNRDRPRVFQYLVTVGRAPVTEFKLVDMVPLWNPSTHKVVRIQVGLNTRNQEEFMHANDWHSTSSNTGDPVIKFRGPTGEDFVLWYEATHVFDYPPVDPLVPLGTTIPDDDEEPLAHLISSMALSIASNHYARKSQLQTYSADTVNYGALSKSLSDRSAAELDFYVNNITALLNGSDAVFVTWETAPTFDQGGGWLLHNRFQTGRYLG